MSWSTVKSSPNIIPAIKIWIIEDNAVTREGFERLINSMDEFHVTKSFSNCENAIKLVTKNPPDVIIMDIELPGMHGIEGIKRIKKIAPDANIIVMTVHEDIDLVFKALCAGACGYISKHTDYSKLLDAIKEVVSGGAPMSNRVARMVVESFQKNYNTPLTKRETEVLTLLARGKSYSMIADDLFIHKETVKSHIKNIYYKLEVNNKADAIDKALKDKLI